MSDHALLYTIELLAASLVKSCNNHGSWEYMSRISSKFYNAFVGINMVQMTGYNTNIIKTHEAYQHELGFMIVYIRTWK